jgi:hypothetical protein
VPRSNRKPAGIDASTRVCCLTGREEWSSPPPGESCKSRRHGHMSLGKVQALVDDGKMEMVQGICQKFRKGVWIEESCWIPVARFVNARRWRKTLSFDGGAAVATMQLVRGG